MWDLSIPPHQLPNCFWILELQEDLPPLSLYEFLEAEVFRPPPWAAAMARRLCLLRRFVKSGLSSSSSLSSCSWKRSQKGPISFRHKYNQISKINYELLTGQLPLCTLLSRLPNILPDYELCLLNNCRTSWIGIIHIFFAKTYLHS